MSKAPEVAPDPSPPCSDRRRNESRPLTILRALPPSREEGGDVAAALRAFRKQARLTQQELARRSFVSIRSIRNIERGMIASPRGSTLSALADALDLAPSERQQLGAPSAVDELPAGLVPAAITPLLGRDPEVFSLVSLLGAHLRRLVTLTGMTGVGKTRLAQSVALELSAVGPVWWVSLTSRGSTRYLLESICEAVDGTPASFSSLVTRLSRRGGLLVLDSVDDIDDPGADLLVRLLAQVPQLLVLAISTQPLGIVGEQTWQVRPLPTPPVGVSDQETLESYPSVQLLADRIRADAPGFALDGAVAGIVAESCRQVDGLPLALELAAGQWRQRGPRGLLHLLRTGVLDLSGPRDCRAELRVSLREVVAGDLALLSREDRRALDCLSVFSGSATVDGAVEVVDHPDALSSIERLVASGMVTAHDNGDERRLSVPRTVTAFCAEDSEAAATRSDAAARHAAHFAIRARTKGVRLHHNLHPDYDDIRRALVWFADESASWVRRGLVEAQER